jgi:Ser/Thr protein kinase RdoA (MazF antagonist)
MPEIQLGNPLAVGRTAEVFAWNGAEGGQVLKLFRAGWGLDAAEHEAAVARQIYDSGAPAPRVDGVIEVAGRGGVIYERIAGPSLLAVLLARPWRLSSVARILAKAHVALYTRAVPHLPDLRSMLARRIHAATPLPPTLRDAALRALDALPDGDSLLHGDYHPDNVLLSARGPLVIDWENAARGDPLADVARTLLLLDAGYIYAGSAATRAVRHAFIVLLRRRYLRRSHQLCPFPSATLAAWDLPVTAARLSEGIEPEEAYLLARVRRLAATSARSAGDGALEAPQARFHESSH